MKILSIGSDRKLFEKDSSVALRSVQYGSLVESMYIVVFSLKSHNLSEFSLGNNIIVYPTNSSSRFWYIFDAIKIGKKIIVDKKFIRGADIITCQDPFESGFVGWRIAHKFNLPFYLQIHTDFLSVYFKTSFLQTLRVSIAKFLLPKANGIRVVSKRILDSINKANIKLKHEAKILPIRVNAEEIVADQTEIPSSSDLKKLFPNFKFIILMASRLAKEKRISDAISVFARILNNHPHIGLCIVGEGPLKGELENQCKKLKISNSVAFLGWRSDVPLLMKTANMFMSVSEYEGYGMSVIEAGLSGCPVLTTNVGIASDFLEHNKNSYICPVGDTLCIYEGVSKLIQDNAFRYQISTKLMDDLKAHILTKEEYSKRYIKLLEEASKI